MAPIVIRNAKAEEAAALSAICVRSKSHWGYGEDFMRRCKDALTVDPGCIEAGHVLAAELDGELVGIAAIGPDDDGFEIDQFFIDPEAMGMGVGKRLFTALLALAGEHKIARLTILSDPNAVAFYLKMGAREIGRAPSDAIPGRTLPLLEIDVPPSKASN
ncbi:GNAT family N-acetyltransferase [Hoeflea prorocentri]|uniref:GNAT family N-acetyltransferase n=1 Tax=Hoeflea prorocentri TaxID=1922333 RepID=A0A9X3UMC9_9HYPH|nr:GNAT family N-acetyltransferase [Hoeflea prorocentri]MCY6383060.1 GNAT family N-acetyltransferase [Hoeflea prorocentri]MDA5400860.1 GNAT family N-acetyltransferase [Hoeflea prorocentri]